MKILTQILTFCAISYISSAANILAIFPNGAYSHCIIGDVLAKELASRGHEVTLLGTLKPKTTINNLNFIELVGVKELMAKQMANFNLFEFNDVNKLMMIVSQIGFDVTKSLYEDENVQKLIKSNINYDLIIMEQFYNEAIYGFCAAFKAPCIAVSAVGAMSWTNRLTGNIGLASYVPGMLTKFSPQMSFFERSANLLLLIFEEVLSHLYHLPRMDKLMHQYIPNAPPLYNLIYNVSLVFLNSHPALTAPRPLTPNMIELGGMHVEGLKDVKLPSDIQSFLDNHNEGVTYFALGSNANSKDMPKEKLQMIIKALKKWGKPILWKYEEELPEPIDNVKVAKWFPQTAVLAHKNVKAFITHCGRLSSLESLYFGVPMIGIPIFAEQTYNAAEMVYYGYAIRLDFKTFKADDLYNALVEISTNSRYSKEAKLRSKAMQKRNALDEAIYWIEHVVEFKGASYLRNAGVDLPWYQLWMVDVIGFLVISFLGFNCAAAYLILRFCNRRSKVNKSSKGITKSKKKN